MADGTVKQPDIPFHDISSGDMNDFKGIDHAGFYYVRTGVTNAPQAWTWYMVIPGAGTVQVGFSENKLLVRAYTGSPLTWTQWKTLNFT